MATAILVTLAGIVLIGFTAWVMVSGDVEDRVEAPKAWANVAARLGLDHFDHTLSGTLDGVNVHVTFDRVRSKYSEAKYTVFSATVAEPALELEINPIRDRGYFPRSDDAERWEKVPNQDLEFGRHYVVHAADVPAAISWLQRSSAMDTMLWLKDRGYVTSLRHGTLEVREAGWVSDGSQLEAKIRDAVDASRRLSAGHSDDQTRDSETAVFTG